MNGKYSAEVTRAIDMIWKSFDPEEMKRGYALLERAAERGDADALCYLARCHMGEEYVWSGGGFETDEDKSSALLKESVLKGSASGVLCALRNENLTPSVECDMPFGSLKEAYEEILRQARDGDAFCLYMAANVLFWGDYLVIEGEAEADKCADVDEYYTFAYPLAAELYEKSFEAGLSAGFGNYRTIYESELGDIDSDRFESYFEMLADGNNPMICNDYGKYLSDEYEDCEEEAFGYYERAFEMGDVRSAYNVAVCYARGCGVDEDLDEAFRYYKISAEAGHPRAQFAVGNFYFSGRGNVIRDYAEAFRWLCRAYDDLDEEERWEPAAELAVLYQDGLGTAQDDEMAFRRLSEIEDRVDDVWEPLDAMVLNALGVAYAFGRGVKADIARGVGYFDRAIEYGSEAAARNKARFKRSVFGLGGWKRIN